MGNVAIKGKVIEVINDTDVAINKGSKEGVRSGNRFLVYYLGDEMFDPDTNEFLGTLELVCGEGEPLHIQDHLTILRSCKTETVNRKVIRNPLLPYMRAEEIYEPEKRVLPFEDVGVGCLVKQIR